MKDFPFFTTDNGIASLTLREIPYTKTAYIKFQDASRPEELLKECMEFCIMAGAETVLGSNHPVFEKYPYHTSVLSMQIERDSLPETDAALFPVTEKTVEQFREIYNRRMKDVPNALYLSMKDGKKLLERGDGYFIHRNQSLLGIGIASGERIDAVATVQKGAGEQIVQALKGALSGDRILLEVASENQRAVRLYQRLGFVITGEISRWYRLK